MDKEKAPPHDAVTPRLRRVVVRRRAAPERVVVVRSDAFRVLLPIVLERKAALRSIRVPRAGRNRGWPPCPARGAVGVGVRRARALAPAVAIATEHQPMHEAGRNGQGSSAPCHGIPEHQLYTGET